MKKFSLLSSLVSLAIIMTPMICQSEEWSRSGTSDVFIGCGVLSGDKTTGSGWDVELDSFIAPGVGFGKHLRENFYVNLDTFFSWTNYKISRRRVSAETDITIVGVNLNVDVNILKARISPLITGGVGLMKFSTADAVQGTVAEETDFSYNVGAGLRWDITDKLNIKAIYRALWTKMEDTDESMMFNGIVVNGGWTF